MPKAKQPAPAASSGLRIGYARKSKEDQDLALQRDALTRAGCNEIYEEQVSRAGPRREKKGAGELANALRALRPGDTLVVWRLDRLGGSVSELIRVVTHELAGRGIGFESLTEKIDTSTAAGNMFFQIAAVFAEYERRQLIERTTAGLEAARARGRKGGRRKSMDDKTIRQAKALLADPNITVAEVCAQFGVSRTTLYGYVGSVIPLREKAAAKAASAPDAAPATAKTKPAKPRPEPAAQRPKTTSKAKTAAPASKPASKRPRRS